MKKSEMTAVKTDSGEKAQAVVLLTGVKDLKLAEAKQEPPKKTGAVTSLTVRKTAITDTEARPKEESKEESKAEPAKETGTIPDPTAEKAPPAKTGTGPKESPEKAPSGKAGTAPDQKTPKASAGKKTPAAPPEEPMEKAAPKPRKRAKAVLPKTADTPPKAGTTAEPKAISGEKPGQGPAPSPKADASPGQNPAVAAPPVIAKTPPVSVVDSPLKLMRQEFTKRANLIRKEMGNIQNSFVVIGFQLHWIKANNMYRVMNYKNICDYAEKEYNIKKSTCCNLINIIENYAERDENGEVVESISECYRNYSSTQLLAMIGMPEELQQQVTPDMSVRAIQRLRKGEPEKPPVDAPRAVVTAAEPPAKTKAISPVSSPMGAAKPVTGPPAAPAGLPGEKTQAAKDKEQERTATAPKAPAIPAEKADKTPERKTPAVNAADTVNLAEIDSYDAYKGMQDKLDIMIKHVFSGDNPVRVKIVCVQG